jgi:hypothetical protein
MNDILLAEEVIIRLNKLIEKDEIRKDISKLIETRVACSKETLDHPAIQAQVIDPKQIHCVKSGAIAPAGLVGFLLLGCT